MDSFLLKVYRMLVGACEWFFNNFRKNNSSGTLCLQKSLALTFERFKHNEEICEYLVCFTGKVVFTKHSQK